MCTDSTEIENKLRIMTPYKYYIENICSMFFLLPPQKNQICII